MGRVGMLTAFNWSNVAVVQESLDTYQGLSNDLITRLKKAKINVVSHETFKGNATNSLENIKVCRL
jgi:D-ribose pyranose/furanose isomerase RbsD